MNSQSLAGRYDVFFATATITAHANGVVDGFRQRDVRFFIELFSNYVDPSSEWEGLPLQNTHISRYLGDLVSEGFAKKFQKKDLPMYRLFRVGLIELVSRIVEKPYYNEPEHFFFVYSFIENYTPRITGLVKREGKKFPYALQLELEERLDLGELLKKQIDFTKRELKTLEQRIHEQNQCKDICVDLLKQDLPFAEVAKRIESQYPYSLNTKKPLTEFLAEGTERQAVWEIIIGGPRRNQQQWIPAKERLELHLKQLEDLGRASLKRAQEGDDISPALVSKFRF